VTVPRTEQPTSHQPYAGRVDNERHSRCQEHAVIAVPAVSCSASDSFGGKAPGRRQEVG
jgi:hypothetical protein